MKVHLAVDPRTPAAARAVVAEHLAAPAAPRGIDVDDAVLAVSELVTNALKAGAATIELELISGARTFDIAVTDDADGWPTAQQPDDTAESGRGLAIVAHVADRWDVQQTGRGKRVVATFVARRHHR